MANDIYSIKPTWEEGLITHVWHRLKEAFTILNKPRISQHNRIFLGKIIAAQSKIIILLLAICITVVTFLGINYFNSQENEIKIVTQELFIINPHLDPGVAPIIAREVVAASKAFKIDKFLVLAILKFESLARVKAKNPESGAMGLMQWLVSDKRLAELNIEEYQVMHIKTNIWEGGMKVLWDGYHPPKKKKKGDMRNGTTKYALFYYNGVVHNITSGNEYAANVSCTYYDIKHRNGF